MAAIGKRIIKGKKGNVKDWVKYGQESFLKGSMFDIAAGTQELEKAPRTIIT